MLSVAGVLFGWERALYSIIFQYASTQVLHMLYKRYQRQTLLIITDKPEEVYELIKDITHHGATLFKGVGLYEQREPHDDLLRRRSGRGSSRSSRACAPPIRTHSSIRSRPTRSPGGSTGRPND